MSIFAGDFGRLMTFAIFIPLLVRIIPPNEYGQYALVMAVFIPLRKFLNFGLFDATKTYGSRSDTDHTRVFITSFWLHVLLVIAGLLISATLILTAPIPEKLKKSLLFVLLAVVGNQFYNYGRGVLHALKKESLVEPLIPTRSVVLAVVGLGLAATGYGVTGVFVGFAVGFLCAGSIATVFGERYHLSFHLGCVS
jgi:O-antigen/teichoic acid export membrane protein